MSIDSITTDGFIIAKEDISSNYEDGSWSSDVELSIDPELLRAAIAEQVGPLLNRLCIAELAIETMGFTIRDAEETIRSMEHTIRFLENRPR